jgi:hypothetical protein
MNRVAETVIVHKAAIDLGRDVETGRHGQAAATMPAACTS